MIEIEKDGNIFPFSKGILARSILPTGLSTDIIYNIADQVEDDFRSARKAVPSSEIHSRVIDILHNRGLKIEKGRYRISHKIAQIDKPVAILIGGTAGVGKSAITAELARRLGIERVIATHEIREVMRYMLPKDLLPTLHQSSFDAADVIIDSDIQENILVGFTRQARLVNRGVHAYLKRSEKEGLKTIFNGVHLVPGMLGIDDEASSMMLFHYMLTLDDEQEHKRRFHSRAKGSYRKAARYIEKIERIREIQKYCEKKIENTKVKKIENVSINRTVTEIIDHLILNLKDKAVNE